MGIINLYKNHINPKADWGEIHSFMSKFDIHKPYVPHPDEDFRKQIELEIQAKMGIAKQWILKNSKLTSENINKEWQQN